MRSELNILFKANFIACLIFSIFFAVQSHADSDLCVTLQILNDQIDGEFIVISGEEIEVSYKVTGTNGQPLHYDVIRLVSVDEGKVVFQKVCGHSSDGSIYLKTDNKRITGEFTVEYVRKGVVVAATPPRMFVFI